jgi:RNA polymerase sigma-70 factor (ECF subfamily)
VLRARDHDRPSGVAALQTLCQTYWYPLYLWLRRQGHAAHDAQDLTQAFFAHLLQNQRLDRASPAQGKFRSFLLASLKNFVTNQWDRSQALKRGAGFTFVSVDETLGEERLRREPSHDATPDKAFERTWALTLLDRVLTRLREQYAGEGKAALFEALEGCLSGDRDWAPYGSTAERLGLSQGALKMAVLRLRRRFGDCCARRLARR